MMTVSRSMLKEMADHASDEYPNECCGALAGPLGSETVTEIIRCHNSAADPRRFYEIGAERLVGLYRALAERGLEPVAWYHSHPTSPPLPSRTDISYMADPRVRYLIVGRVDGETLATCWRINPMTGQPYEEEISVVRA